TMTLSRKCWIFIARILLEREETTKGTRGAKNAVTRCRSLYNRAHDEHSILTICRDPVPLVHNRRRANWAGGPAAASARIRSRRKRPRTRARKAVRYLPEEARDA